jgi:hypothetical protein
MFELMYWVCDSTRENFMSKIYTNKNVLVRLENALAEPGFIEKVDNKEPMSYIYKSKYTKFIRRFRDKLINRKLPLDKYNTKLDAEQHDFLYSNVSALELDDTTLGHVENYKLSTVIALVSAMHYGMRSRYPTLFMTDIKKEIEKALAKFKLNSYRYLSYIDGLKKYYFMASMKANKKIANAASGADNEAVAELAGE